MGNSKKDRFGTDMEYWEEGQYGTEKIKYDSEEANEEAKKITEELVEAAKKRGQEKK